MSQAENLLNSLVEEVPQHTHHMGDPDGYFVIDPDTRIIDCTSDSRPTLMQFDHDSEIFTFEVPRYIENHDMILCNKVKVHYINIDGVSMAERADVHEIYDLKILDNSVICSWKIDRRATQYAGTLNFLLQYLCLDDEGNATYEWHTDIYTDVLVKKGMNNGNPSVMEYTDVLEQWYARLFGAGDSVMADITAMVDEKTNTAIEALELKGAEVLDSIPEDYTTVANMAEDAARYKANAVVLDAEGTSITVNNSDDAYLLGLTVYGKTTQKTTVGYNLFNPSILIRAGWGETTPGTYVGPVDALNNRTVDGINFKENTPYAISFDSRGSGNGSHALIVKVYYTDGDMVNAITTSSSITSQHYEFVSEPNKTIDYIEFGYNTKQTVRMSDIQITEGNAFRNYEPYTGGKASPRLDYPQNLNGITETTVHISGNTEQSITVPGTLHGIRSLSGGYHNMVDDNGTKWVADEADFDKGIFNQRVKTIELTGDEAWNDMSEDLFMYGDRLFTTIPEWDTEKYPNAIIAWSVEGKCYRFGAVPGPLKYGTFYTTNMGENNGVYFYTPAGSYSERFVRDYVNGAWSEGVVKTIDRTNSDEGVYSLFNNVIWSNSDITNKDDSGVYLNGTEPVPSPYGERQAYCMNLDVKAVDGLCTHLKSLGELESGNEGVYLKDSCAAIMQVKDVYPTLAEFKEFLASEAGYNRPVTIAYGVEIPVESPMDDNAVTYYKQLKTSYPATTFTSNVNMKVKYAADTRLYFETLLGVIENGSY